MRSGARSEYSATRGSPRAGRVSSICKGVAPSTRNSCVSVRTLVRHGLSNEFTAGWPPPALRGGGLDFVTAFRRLESRTRQKGLTVPWHDEGGGDHRGMKKQWARVSPPQNPPWNTTQRRDSRPVRRDRPGRYWRSHQSIPATTRSVSSLDVTGVVRVISRRIPRGGETA